MAVPNVPTPTPDQDTPATGDKKNIAVRFAKAVARGTGRFALNTVKTSGRMTANAGRNFVDGHWHDSGLQNIFGSLDGIIGTKKWKGRGKGRKKNGTKASPLSGLGDSKAIVKAIKEGLAPIETALDGLDGSFSGLRDDIQLNTDVTRKGLLAILRALSSNAPNPFAGMSNARRAKPKLIPVIPSKPSTALGGDNKLLGKGGLIGSAISGLISGAKSLAGVVGALLTSVGAVYKFAKSIPSALGAGLASLGRSTRTALGGRGERAAAKLAPGATPTPNEPVRPSNAPEKVRPGAEPAKPKETVTPKDTVAPKERVPPTVDKDGNVKSKFEPNVKSTDTQAKAEKAVADVKNNLEGKPAETVKPNAPEPQHKPESAKSTSETIKENSSKGAASGAGEVAKDSLKQTTKLGAKGLSLALAKYVAPGALIAIEAWDGYNEWSEAYDKFSKGEMPEEEYRKVQSKIVGKHTGSIIGGLAGGAATGAIGGMIAGPLGAAVGGVVGGIGGAIAGGWAGEKVSEGVLGQVVADGLQGRTKNAPVPQSRPVEPPVRVRTTERRFDSMDFSTPDGVRMTQSETAMNRREATKMIEGSERLGNIRQAPTIIHAPQTTNNNNTGNSGSGNGDARMAPGSATPSFSGLDFQSTGMGIPLLPGN